MSVPSYMYAALNPSVESLASTLSRMGGGDARVARMEAHCLVASAPGDKSLNSVGGQVLWVGEDAIGVRNIDLSPSAPIADCMSYHHVTACHELRKKDFNFVDVMPHKEIAQWLLDGFNSTVVGIGERGAWKSTTLFGRSGAKVEASPYPHGYPPCLIVKILASLFEVSATNGLSIGIACWAVRGNDVVDLLKSEAPGTKSGPLDFTTMECSDLAVALNALSLARSRCPGCCTHDATTSAQPSEAARAHFFVRVVVYRPDSTTGKSGQISCLHVVDCIGAAAVGDSAHQRMPEEDRIARRTTAIQLSTLSKVLEEMRQVWKNMARTDADSDPYLSKYSAEARLTSARESKLTTLLAPMLQGNARTWFLCFFMDGVEHYQASLSTLRSIDAIMELKNPCHRVRGVDYKSLAFVRPEAVFPMSMTVPGRDRKSDAKSDSSDYDEIRLTNAKIVKDLCENGLSADPKQVATSPPLNPSGGATRASFDELMSQYKQFMGSLEGISAPADKKPQGSILTQSVESIAPPSPPPSPPVAPKGTSYLHRSIEDEEREISELFDNARRGYDSLRFSMHHEVPNVTPNPNVWATTNLEKGVVNPWTMNFASEHVTELAPPSPPDRLVASEKEIPQANNVVATYSAPASLKVNSSSVDEKSDSSPQIKEKSVVKSPIKVVPPQESTGYSSFDQETAAPRFVSASDARRNVDARLRAEKESKTNERAPDDSSISNSDICDLTADSKEEFVIPKISPSKLTDIEHLRNINESLMSAVSAEKKRAAKLAAELRRSSESQEEERLQLSIELDNLRLENNNLKNQFRKLVSDQSLDDMLEYFEGEMRHLANENYVLRKRNTVVEGQLMLQACSAPAPPFLASSLSLQTANRQGGSVTLGAESIWQCMEGAISYTGTDRSEVNGIRALNKKLSKDIEALQTKLEESSQRERRGVIVERLYKDVSKKLEGSLSELARIRRELDVEREARRAAETATAIVQAEIKSLHASDRELRGERGAILSELAELRNRVREFDIERSKYLSIKNFAERHASRQAPPKGPAERLQLIPRPSGLWGVEAPSRSDGVPMSRPQSAPRGSRGNSSGSSGVAFHVPGAASRKAIQMLNEQSASSAPNDTASLSSVEPYDSLMQSLDMSVPGLAGLVNAHYLRKEQAEPLSPVLEDSLLALRDSVAVASPGLLPLVRRLAEDLREDRAASLQQKARMISTIQKHRYETATAASVGKTSARAAAAGSQSK